MKYLKQIWNFLLAEPFRWLFYCFFQPGSFAEELKIERGLGNILSTLRVSLQMFRLVLPLFILAYPLTLIGRFILLKASLLTEVNAIAFWLGAARFDAFCVVGILISIIILII